MDAKITAAVIYYGAAPWPLKNPPPHFPPLLILHGDADQIIPVSEARRLARIARGFGGTAELVIYPGFPHGFGIAVVDEAGPDSFRRTAAFLKKQLLQSGMSCSSEDATRRTLPAQAAFL